MKRRAISIVLAASMLAVTFAGCGSSSGSTSDGTLSVAGKDSLKEDLADNYKISGMTDLAVGGLTAEGVDAAEEDGAVTLTQDKRTVSHGNIYASEVTIPITGDIKKDDAVVVHFSMKNSGGEDSSTNFLSDLYTTGDESRTTWLTRNPIFLPGTDDYEECYIYGYAPEDTDSATFEITTGWAAQKLSIKNVTAARYDGPLKESYFEKLPHMARTGDDGSDVWYTYWGYDRYWRQEAAQMIEANRKGDVTVNVVDADGNPVSGAEVAISQTATPYEYGTAVSADAFTGNDAQENVDTYKDFYNILTLANDLKWDEGSVKPYAEEALEYLAANGMKVHGHVLLWPGIDRDPYDDGVDNKPEFVTTPQYIVKFTHVIAAMQKMDNDPTTGYGEGTIAALKSDCNDALDTFDKVLSGEIGDTVSGNKDSNQTPDEVTTSQVNAMKEMVTELLASCEGKADTDTTLDGLHPTLEELQQELYDAVIEHVRTYAQYYSTSGAVVEWDALNEIMNLGNRGVVNALGEDQGTFDGTSTATDGGAYQNQLFVDVLRTAKEASGGVPLSINDVSWQSNQTEREWYVNLMTWLKEQDAPIDFLGLQAYMRPANIQTIIDPDDTWAEYDKLAALGIQTEITEYDLGEQDWSDTISDAETLANLQADFLHDYVIENFAHANSRGFIAWGGIPMDSAVGSVFYKLVYQQQWTNDTVTADENGAAADNAYLGTYTITATADDGRSGEVTAEITESHASGNGNVITVTVQ